MMPDSVVPEGPLAALVALAETAPAGAFAEFGVYKGGSAARLAEVARRGGHPLFLFDTFTGIPVRRAGLDAHLLGDFGDTSLEAVRAAIPDAVIVAGEFPQSTEGLALLPPLAFVHVDADQYDSVKAACDYFPRFMVAGGILIFDDYGCLDGATAAVNEWVESNRLTISTTAHGKAVWRKP